MSGNSIRFSGLIFLFTLLFFLSGCYHTSSYQYMDPAYEGKNQFYTTILILSLNNELLNKSRQQQLLGNKEIKPLLLSRQELNYFNNYMGPAVSEVAIADILGIDPYFRPKMITFEYFEFRMEEGKKLNMFAPSSGKLRYKDTLPDYVLFFEDLFFLKDYVEERTGIGSGTKSKYTLETGVEYLLWDNNKETIIGYGMLTKSLNLFDYPTKDNYIDIFEEFARSILTMSPIAWKQVR